MSNTVLTDEDIFQRFRQIVAKSLALAPEAVMEDAYLDDLGAESLDLVEIGFSCEDEFQILMPEKNILESSNAVFGEGVLHKDGFLTEEGKRLLQRRMPEFEKAAQEGPVSLADINKALLRVSAWVRLIRSLIDASPKLCSACNTPLVSTAPGRKQCSLCGTAYEIPPGDSVNRAWVQHYYEHEYLPSLSSR